MLLLLRRLHQLLMMVVMAVMRRPMIVVTMVMVLMVVLTTTCGGCMRALDERMQVVGAVHMQERRIVELVLQLLLPLLRRHRPLAQARALRETCCCSSSSTSDGTLGGRCCRTTWRNVAGGDIVAKSGNRRRSSGSLRGGRGGPDGGGGKQIGCRRSSGGGGGGCGCGGGVAWRLRRPPCRRACSTATLVCGSVGVPTAMMIITIAIIIFVAAVVAGKSKDVRGGHGAQQAQAPAQVLLVAAENAVFAVAVAVAAGNNSFFSIFGAKEASALDFLALLSLFPTELAPRSPASGRRRRGSSGGGERRGGRGGGLHRGDRHLRAGRGREPRTRHRTEQLLLVRTHAYAHAHPCCHARRPCSASLKA